ncbi:hypothetical protein G9464_00590 [Halostella sp. JP-L12]|uniref:hypothetical protein n=1 Tax=Halostella TaxID=1843185 RepID=UPI0013CF2FFA|nr:MULTISPECIES: hypothetical protein [Halostella]NHN46095.1 hypothetical protein [Halostella sp. JP-L12]
MVWNVVLGFVLLVVASYVGTTMALRGFFGREYYDPNTGEFVAPSADGEDETADPDD